jgi:hypothetical protein
VAQQSLRVDRAEPAHRRRCAQYHAAGHASLDPHASRRVQSRGWSRHDDFLTPRPHPCGDHTHAR